MDSRLAQPQPKPKLDPIPGELHEEEQERKVLPRSASECSDYWIRMQEEVGPRSRAESADHSTDYDFRPRTPTVLNESVPPSCRPVAQDEAALLRKNSELEDRVAELERKLLELAAAKGAAA